VLYIDDNSAIRKGLASSVFQTFVSGLQMFNFCFALNIYTTSKIEGDISTVREFHNWILVEILTTISTILGAMVFLLRKKCLGKGKLTFSPDDAQDETQDYMGSQVNLIVLLIELQAWCPMITNVLLLKLKEHSRLSFADDASIDALEKQFYMQALQYTLWYWILYISMKSYSWLKRIHYTVLICFMIFIPIASILHWFMVLDQND
jgi:hypothetical protein